MRRPDARHLRTQLIRAALAKSDMRTADLLAQHLVQLSEERGEGDFVASDLAWGLYTAIAVSYARPFVTSRGYGRLPVRFERFPRDRGDLGWYHGLVMDHRQTLLAHNDSTPYRGVLVFTRGHFGPAASATTHRVTLNVDGMKRLPALFAYQIERLDEHEAELLELLQAVERWRDGVEIEITLEGSGTESVPAAEPPDEESPA